MLTFDVDTDHKGRFEGFVITLSDDNGTRLVWAGSWDPSFAVGEAERVIELLRSVGHQIALLCNPGDWG